MKLRGKVVKGLITTFMVRDDGTLIMGDILYVSIDVGLWRKILD